MTTLLKNGHIVNVFTNSVEKANILMDDDGRILGIGDYDTADVIEDVSGKILCPAFIDSHIHIESTMLTPYQLAKVCLLHGTSTIVADPHEIANVCGLDGLFYILKATDDLPLTTYIMLPSCVPSTSFDESGATLLASDLKHFYSHPRVLGLAEVMNYPGVIHDEETIMEKIRDARAYNKIVNGHAPLLSGKELDKYICSGVQDDHECSNEQEAKERIAKGQWVMIREGTSARNLEGLLPLFEEPYSHRCVLVTDDKHPKDLLMNGHMDSIIRKAVRLGKNPITGIKMATIQAAECFGLRNVGALAPGYKADVLVLNDLNTVDVGDVYIGGKKVVSNKKLIDFEQPPIRPEVEKGVYRSFYMNALNRDSFYIEPKGSLCRVIEVIKNELLTNERVESIDFSKNNGIDTDRDILKIAVCERHNHTNHIGVAFIKGIGLKKGAIASSVSHDSHNLVIVGTSDEEMALAGNTVIEMSGGLAVVEKDSVKAKMALPIAGLMSPKDAETLAKENDEARTAAYSLGSSESMEPFMCTAFMALPVIPHLKITTLGLVDVDHQKLVPLFVRR